MSSNERAIVATGDVLYSGQHNVLSGGSRSGSWWARFSNVDPTSVAQFLLGHARDYESGSQDIPVEWGQAYEIRVLEGAADPVTGAVYQQTYDVGEASFKAAAGESVADRTTLSVPSYDQGSYGVDQPPGVPSVVLAGQVLPVPSQITVVVLPAV
jgi:hypothetical protein